MDARIVPTEKDFFVGKCQSCRHSQEEKVGPAGKVGLLCYEDFRAVQVKPQWQCSRYEYEPGSLG